MSNSKNPAVYVTRACESCGQEFRCEHWKPKRFCNKRCSDNMSWRKRHGVSLTQEYAVWKHMRNRCNNPNCRDYRLYGARGITIDPRWDVYENFREDMGARPSSDHSLDRIDNSKGYGPDNCKWSTRSEQAKNRRPWNHWKYRDDATCVNRPKHPSTDQGSK